MAQNNRSIAFRREMVCLAVVFMIFGSTAITAAGEERFLDKRPNIVLIMADDLGWMDLNCQGNPKLHTPHLNRLASQGIRFTDAYAAAPVCSPTRAALMTGLAPARLHITNHLPDQERFMPENARLNPAPCEDFLKPDYMTLAEHLKQAGYRTGFFGKWHLSDRAGRQGKGNPLYYPENQGFDLNVGGCSYGGPPTFFDPYRIHNLPPRKNGEYLPDRLTDESIRFISADRTTAPFFLCLWNYTVHWPMEAPAELIKKYEGKKGPGIKDIRYAAMIEAYDVALGRLFEYLDEQKLTDNTLVIFTSDNGAFGGVSDLRPLRAAKGYLYEGGIRVPAIVRFPGRIRPGTVSHEPIITMDFFRTILDVAGIEPKGDCDGLSLMPLFSGKSLGRDSLYFHYPNYAFHKGNRLGSAIRQGRYKLIRYFDEGSTELYDLQNDIGEKKNLSDQRSEIAKNLEMKLLTWLKQTKANLPTPRTIPKSQ